MRLKQYNSSEESHKQNHHERTKRQFRNHSVSNGGWNNKNWATQRLREYIVKGFTINDELLKQAGGGNYFSEEPPSRAYLANPHNRAAQPGGCTMLLAPV